MTDEIKGGSDPKGTDNKTAKVSVDQMAADMAALKLEVDSLKKTNEDLTKQLKAANDVLEAQAREKLVGAILPRSKFTVEDLQTKTLEDLQGIKATLDQAKPAIYKNIHFPVAGDQDVDRDTVGDLSVVSAARQKQGRP